MLLELIILRAYMSNRMSVLRKGCGNNLKCKKTVLAETITKAIKIQTRRIQTKIPLKPQ